MIRNGRLIRWGLVVAVLLGLGGGLLTPKPGQAAWYTIDIQIHPGGGSTLSCGWHGGPCYDDDSQVSSGWALDFAPSATISFVSKASTDSASYAVAGQGTVAVGSQTSCSHVTSVNVYDNNSVWRGGVGYTNTSNSRANGYNFNISTGYFTPVQTSVSIGSTANETGCGASWTGYHVHQESQGGWNKLNYPDHTTCNTPNITTDCWLGNAYAMLGYSWSVSYP